MYPISFDKKNMDLRIPKVVDPCTQNYLSAHLDWCSLRKGTTVMVIHTKDGILVGCDSRASQGTFMADGNVQKVIEINDYLLGTMAGGAADCQFWQAWLACQVRIQCLKRKKKVSVKEASRMLADAISQYRGRGLSIGTFICGWDDQGPSVYMVDDEGSRVTGKIFSVGSGST